MCSRTRTKKIIVVLALVALPVGCAFSYQDHMHRHYITHVIHTVLYFAFFSVVPMTILIINVLLVREVRRASNYAASLGLHHQSTSSNCAVPTVMVIATSLVYVLLLGTASILWLASLWTDSDSLYKSYVIVAALSCLAYAYNFFVYLITGKQFRSELRAIFSRCSSSSSSSAAAAVVVVYDRNDARLAVHRQAESAV